MKSFAGREFASDKVYVVDASGPNESGNAGGEIEEISTADIAKLRPSTVLGAQYPETTDGTTDQEVVVQSLNTWVRGTDSKCDDNGWFS